MNHVHNCKIFCHALDPSELEDLGIPDKINEDLGSWLGCSIRMSKVSMLKLTTDEPANPTYGCTTVFLEDGDTIIIDTPFEKFQRLFTEYFNKYSTNIGGSGLSIIDESTDL